MSKRFEITSTEEFHDSSSKESDSDLNTTGSKRMSHSKNRFINIKYFSGKKKVFVGIVPRRREIILVKSQKNKQGYHNLIDYHMYPISGDVKKDSPDYSRILATAFSSFCKSDEKVETWCVIPSMDVVTKFLTIPRVNLKKIYNVVYWSFKKEISFDEEKTLFDFDIIGDTNDGGIDKIEVLAYTVPFSVINAKNDLFRNAHIPLSGISITAFGVQSLLRTQFLKPNCNTVCTMFVGHDWSRIDIFTQKNLYLSRDIKTGYQSFVNNIADVLPQKGRSQSEQTQYADDFFNEKLIYSELNNLEKNTHFSKIEPVTDRLVSQIERTFDYFSSNSGKSPVEKIYLTGRLCDFNGLPDYLSKKLSVSVEIIDVFAESEFQNTPIFMLKSVSDVYLPAFGASCSHDNYTPNFINTFKDKESVKKSKIIDWTFLLVASLLFLLLSGITSWQKYQMGGKNNVISHLETEVEKMGPLVSEDMILEKNNAILKYQKRVKDTANHFFSISAASEICRLTSKNIRLVDMIIKNLKTEGAFNRTLSVNGYIFEEKLLLDASLAGYREALNSSPLFNDISVLKKSFEVINDKAVIFFEMKMDIIQDLQNG
ncbi:MAG: pilus assembly protein PilM [Desulfobacteraceae bacterium]|nr:pilus assembly protein PilM [Desulfobacteraceae bacterium]